MACLSRMLPTVVAILSGMLVLKWEWIAGLVGIPVLVDRGTSMLATEYWIGMAVVFVLGVVFPINWFSTAVWFMFGPTIVTHVLHVMRYGVPNLWPLELAIIVILTIPYIAASYGGAFTRRRWSSSQPSAP